jgi:hypothetical protein
MNTNSQDISASVQPYFSEEEIRTLYKLNCIKTPGYLLIIKGATQPEGRNLHIEDVTRFCQKWGISISAFYRAAKTLEGEHGIKVIAKLGRVSRYLEAEIRDRLHQKLGGEIEVSIPVGRIDLLTATELIEVKQIKEWKDALGQVLSYSAFFPNHIKRIHLFGLANSSKLAIAQLTCSSLHVSVTFEESCDG